MQLWQNGVNTAITMFIQKPKLAGGIKIALYNIYIKINLFYNC